MNSNQSTRRQMLGLGVISVGALALARASKAQDAPAPAAPAPAPEPSKMMPPSASDMELLRSALLVEQVSGAYYAQVLGAQNGRSYLMPKVVTAVTEMAGTKNAHVAAIQSALGITDDAPAFKFPRPAFISAIGMPWLGFTLEEIAIGAHLSALDKMDSRSLRPVVAGIIGANSSHAAMLRTLSGTQFSPRYFESKLTPAQVEMYLSAYRA